MKIVNKKAYFNYQVLEDFTAGLVLVGSEVKSLRENGINFGDSFIVFKDGELWIKSLTISKYKQSSFQNHDLVDLDEESNNKYTPNIDISKKFS